MAKASAVPGGGGASCGPASRRAASAKASEFFSVQVPGAVADGLGVPAAERPLRAITMGFGPLRAARRLLLLAIGPAKRRAVRALVDGPADPRWPASLLRDHPEFDVLVTRDAMGEP